MDRDSQDLVKAVAHGTATGTTSVFLDKLLGPAVEGGEMLRDRVRLRRWKAEVKMLAEAERFLEELGVDPSHVPAKVLFPLLDFASLEDEDDEAMLSRWAGLLANAAAGTDIGAAVLPSFPRILAELSPEEAVILDVLYEDADPARVPSLYFRYSEDPMLSEETDPLRLLEASWEDIPLSDDPPEYLHTVSRLTGTALGLSFVLACTPPK